MYSHYVTVRTEDGLSVLNHSFYGWNERELTFTDCEKGTDDEGTYWTQYFTSSEKLEHEKCRELFDIKSCIDAKFNMVLDTEDPEFNSEGDNFLKEEDEE